MSVHDIPPDPKVTSLEERIAALEEALANPLRTYIPSWTPLTEAEEAELRESITEAAKMRYRAIPLPPPLNPDEIRQILRECVTIVRPGETLVIRGRDWTPSQVHEIQQCMDAMHEDGRIPFRALAVLGDGLGVAEPRP